jgi:hypothetical protein
MFLMMIWVRAAVQRVRSQTMTSWSARFRIALLACGMIISVCGLVASALGMVGAAVIWTPAGAVLVLGGIVASRHSSELPTIKSNEYETIVNTSRLVALVALATAALILMGVVLTLSIAIRFPIFLVVCGVTVIWSLVLAGISESVSHVRLAVTAIVAVAALALACTATDLQLSIRWRDVNCANSSASAALPRLCVAPHALGVFSPRGELSDVANASIHQESGAVELVWSAVNCTGETKPWLRVEVACDHLLFARVRTAWLNLCGGEQVEPPASALPLGEAPNWLTGACAAATVCASLAILARAHRGLITLLDQKTKQEVQYLFHPGATPPTIEPVSAIPAMPSSIRPSYSLT